MVLLIDQLESGRFVDLSRGMEDVVCPQLHLLVIAGSREIDAFVDESSAESKPACIGLDEKESKLSDRVGLRNQKNTSDSLSTSPGDPASLADGIEFLGEFRYDLLDEILEAVIPTVFFGINLTVTPDHPIEVIESMSSQREGLRFHGRKSCNSGARW